MFFGSLSTNALGAYSYSRCVILRTDAFSLTYTTEAPRTPYVLAHFHPSHQLRRVLRSRRRAIGVWCVAAACRKEAVLRGGGVERVSAVAPTPTTFLEPGQAPFSVIRGTTGGGGCAVTLPSEPSSASLGPLLTRQSAPKMLG
jgi:hypothetical protein